MSYIWIYLLEVSCCLTLFYLLYYIVLRQIPAFNTNRMYLLLSYPVSFLIPLFSVKMYPVFYEIPANTVGTIAQNIPENIVESAAINYWNILFVIYGIIAVLFLIKLIYSILSIFKTIYSGKRQRLNDYILVQHDAQKTYSFFRYLLYPKSVDLLPEIIEHELTHIRQKHSIDIIISEIVKAILWINPVVYLLQRAIKLNHEYICDRKASQINGAYNYAKLLARCSMKEHNLILTNNFSYKLKNRIIMLQHSVNSKSQTWRYFLIIPMLIATLHLFAFDDYYVPIMEDNEVSLSDTIPMPPIKTITVTDTIFTFDPNTFEEQITIVTSEQEVVEALDTIVTFDPNTLEETIRVVKSEILLDEYKVRVEEGAPKMYEPRSMAGDTVITFDPKTGKETMEIIKNKTGCYVLFWGKNVFLGSNNVISKSQFKSLIDKKLGFGKEVKSDCEEVDTFVGEFAFVPNGGTPTLQRFDEKDNRVEVPNIEAISEGALIFINNIKVNGEPLDNIRLEVK